MMLDGAEDVYEMFRNSFPYSFLFFVPLLLMVSPVAGSQSFPVYRVQHFDLSGKSYGSRSTLVNFEAKLADSNVVSRRCVVIRLADLTLSKYRDLLNQNAGAILIILPDQLESLSTELKQQFYAIEKAMVSEETLVPVYFTRETDEVQSIYQQVGLSSTGDASVTATAALLHAATANGFHLGVNVNAAQQMTKFKALNIHGVLEGNGNPERLPTFVVVAHYDSFGAAPGLSYGADSNGSGVAALLELARVFSRLYSSPSSHPAYNLVFLLSGAGKFNYFGTKRWLDEMEESTNFPYLGDVSLVLCLEGIGKDGDLYMHVSKPPKPDTVGGEFLKNLESVGVDNGMHVEMAHKKIVLGEPQLAWEHEQFAMHRLPGCTLSSLVSHKDPERNSALDFRSSMSSAALLRNTQTIGESLAQMLFNIDIQTDNSSVRILQNDLAVNSDMLDAWLNVLSSESRATQLMDAKHPILLSLEQAMNRYLKSVTKTSYGYNKKDPEFILYGSTVETMSAYSVKPAVFDLILALCIAAYLGLVYGVSQVFHPVIRVMTGGKIKSS